MLVRQPTDEELLPVLNVELAIARTGKQTPECLLVHIAFTSSCLPLYMIEDDDIDDCRAGTVGRLIELVVSCVLLMMETRSANRWQLWRILGQIHKSSPTQLVEANRRLSHATGDSRKLRAWLTVAKLSMMMYRTPCDSFCCNLGSVQTSQNSFRLRLCVAGIECAATDEKAAYHACTPDGVAEHP